MKKDRVKRIKVYSFLSTLSFAILVGYSMAKEPENLSQKPDEVQVVANHLSEKDLADVFTPSQEPAPKIPFIIKEDILADKSITMKPDVQSQPSTLPGSFGVNQPKLIDKPIIQNVTDEKKLQLAEAEKEKANQQVETSSVDKEISSPPKPPPTTPKHQMEKKVEVNVEKKPQVDTSSSVSKEEVASLKAMIQDLQKKLSVNQEALQKKINKTIKKEQKSNEPSKKKPKPKKKVKKETKQDQNKEVKNKKKPEKSKEKSEVLWVKADAQVNKKEVDKKEKEKLDVQNTDIQVLPSTPEKKEEIPIDPSIISALQTENIYGFIYEKEKHLKAPLLEQATPEMKKRLETLPDGKKVFVLYKPQQVDVKEQAAPSPVDMEEKLESAHSTDQENVQLPADPTIPENNRDVQMGFIFTSEQSLFFTIENGKVQLTKIPMKNPPTSMEFLQAIPLDYEKEEQEK